MRLTFVYNADAGFINAALDTAHKLFSPATYTCRLCQLTHGYFGMQPAWRDFLGQLGHEVVFLHRDQYLAKGGDPGLQLPVVLADTGGGSRVLLTAADLQAISSLEQLQTSLLNLLSQQTDRLE